MRLSGSPARRALGRNGLAIGGIAAAWLLVALLFSAQGYLASLYRGTPQPWWPSFGYTLSICAIWALITPVLVQAVRRLEGAGKPLRIRIIFYGAGLPAANALHVGLFALIFWPMFNDGGRIAGRWAMAERMLYLNLDTNALFYAAIVGGTIGGAALARKRRTEQPEDRATEPLPTAGVEGLLRIRSHGGVRFVPLDQVDWIGAAGNYAEIHSSQGSFLADESLAALSRRLPAHAFARIHRGTILRLARIREVRSLGRGDAIVRLTNGTELRLSRRFRRHVEPWIGSR
jgi:hypothetical protein